MKNLFCFSIRKDKPMKKNLSSYIVMTVLLVAYSFLIIQVINLIIGNITIQQYSLISLVISLFMVTMVVISCRTNSNTN